MFIAPRMPSPLAGLKELPRRVVIAKWGRNESVNGDFTVGPKTVRLLPMLQKLLGFDTVALDFEHNTLPGTEAYKTDKEPRNVAAHGAPRVIEGEGIVFEDAQWTPSGEQSVLGGLHPDLSPTIKTDDAGEVVFVHSAALCRQGAVPGLRMFSAADIFTAEQLQAFSAASGTISEIRPPQSEIRTPSMDYKKLLCLTLGLDPATATDADIEAAAKAKSETTGEVKAFAAQLTSTAATIAALEKRLNAAERSQLVSDAMGAGKIIPHGAEIDALDNAAFKAVLASLEAGKVPLAQRTPEGIKAFSATTAPVTSDSEDQVRRQLGISETDWNK